MPFVVRALGVVMLFGAAGAPAAVAPPFWTGREDAASLAKGQEARVARASALVERMLRARGPRTVENTLRPFDRALFEIDTAEAQTALVQNVHPDAAMREAAEKANQRCAAARTALMLNRGVYDAMLQVSADGEDAATQHYLKRVLRDFRLAGVDKDEPTRRRVAALLDEIVAIGQEFGRNIREDRRTVNVRHAGELAGLPKDYIDRHRPDERGVIRIVTDGMGAGPVFSYARSDSLRRAVYLEYNNRGCPQNLAVLERLLARRHELATLLGFATWADYVSADKMTGSAPAASAFIDRIVAASGPRAQKDYERLLARKQQEQPQAKVIHAWESSYWMEQVRQSEYQYDSQQVRVYFPAARVKQGLLDVTSQLFGVSFRRVEGAPVWHPSVECWEIVEAGQIVGRVYFDLHPRADKYSHAAHFTVSTGIAGEQLPEAALVCNLPGGEAGDPGLMEHKDVSTFFHEFGHLLHSLFGGRQRWAGLSGVATEFDFVEAPSQLFEEWIWSAQVLATFARHHETGEPIPADLVRRMKSATEFGKGLHVRRQMSLARIALSYYDRPPAQVDTDTILREVTESHVPHPFVEGTHFQCMFQHLDHYSAFYYTYMWSLVIAKDLYSQFDPENLLDPAVARRYRETVLAPGGSAPAATLAERFLGRPFNAKAWEDWLNAD